MSPVASLVTTGRCSNVSMCLRISTKCFLFPGIVPLLYSVGNKTYYYYYLLMVPLNSLWTSDANLLAVCVVVNPPHLLMVPLNSLWTSDANLLAVCVVVNPPHLLMVPLNSLWTSDANLLAVCVVNPSHLLMVPLNSLWTSDAPHLTSDAIWWPHYGLLTPYDNIDWGQDWLSLCLTTPSYYLNQC